MIDSYLAELESIQTRHDAECGPDPEFWDGLEAHVNQNRIISGWYQFPYLSRNGVPGVVKIVRTPNTLGGEPRIAGTRISISGIVELYNLYYNELGEHEGAIWSIHHDFPAYPEFVIRAVLQWYDQFGKEEVDTILEECRRDEEELHKI